MLWHFEGEYNDYGAVENCKGTFIPHLLEEIKNQLVEMEQGENQYHDIPVTKQDFNIEKLFDADHEGRLFVKNRYAHLQKDPSTLKSRLTHIVIRKEVFETIKQQHLIESYESVNGTYELVTRTYDETLTKALDQLRATASIVDHPMGILRMSLLPLEYALLKNLIDHNQLSAFDIIHDLAQTWDEQLASEAMVQLVDEYWLHSFMNDGRKAWSPTTGAGSQDDSTKAQRLLASIIVSTADKFDTRWDNEDE